MHFFLEKSAQRYDFLNKYSSKTLLILGCAQIFFSTIYKKGVTGTRGNDSARTRTFLKKESFLIMVIMVFAVATMFNVQHNLLHNADCQFAV